MRNLMTFAAALAVGGAISLGSAAADPTYYPGGEIQRTGMCQVTTDPFGFYGYMTPCPVAAPVAHRHKKHGAH